VHPFITTIVASTVILAAIIDVRSQKIPNVLTFSLAGVSFLYHAVVPDGSGLMGSFLGYLTGLVFYLIPYLMGWMGAGDTKLLAAIGAAVGVRGVVSVSLLTSLAGGLYVLLLLFYSCLRSKETLVGLHAAYYSSNFLPQLKFELLQQAKLKPKICYGAVMAAGTLCYLIFENNGTDVLKILFYF
jgi:prepilin peptidase CpaA